MEFVHSIMQHTVLVENVFFLYNSHSTDALWRVALINFQVMLRERY